MEIRNKSFTYWLISDHLNPASDAAPSLCHPQTGIVSLFLAAYLS